MIKHVILPVFIGAAVLLISTTLLFIGARSPYTHANLDLGYDTRYNRTIQSIVGAPAPFVGGELVAHPANDPVEHGRRLFVTHECAACHGLDGRGGIVGPSITGTKASKLRSKTMAGPGGMPAYAPETLSDDGLAAIAAYLGSMGEASGSAPMAMPSTEKAAPQPTASDMNPSPEKTVGGDLIGPALYQVSCAACHGEDRAGKKLDQDGQTVDIPTLAWDELSKMYQTKPGRGTVPEQVALAITKGQDEEGEDLGPLMPRWSSLSQPQVDSLIQYLQTGNTTAGAAPEILQAVLNLKGEQLYQAACAACHGQDHAGKKIDQDGKTIEIPTLAWDELSKMYQAQPQRGTVEEQVALAITKGQNEEGEDLGPLMPRWSFLSKEQVDSLLQYLNPAGKASNPPGTMSAMPSSSKELQGEQLYLVSCAACHGEDRAGKKFAKGGQTIDVPTLAWDELSKMYQAQPSRGTVPEQLVLTITKGQDEEGEEMGPLMPRWSALSREQVVSLIQFLQSPGSANRAALKSMPTDLLGEQLYQAACAACHGQDRAGRKIEQDGQMIEIPTLTWDELSKMYQTQPGRGTVAQQIALAITKGQNEEGEDLTDLMPRWSSLTKEQVESLIQYLQTATR